MNFTLINSAVSPTNGHSEATGLLKPEKIEKIADLFGEIMKTLGLDLTDDSLRETSINLETNINAHYKPWTLNWLVAN